ncbi:MAG: PCP reductase family protein, partial [Candidatus Rokubacteria bacterium]|nr:PCP reductase family protein [Candidatus Rokubacteria bacterium]
PRADGPVAGVTMLWTAEAEERLRRIPLAPIREMVVRRTEAWARARGLEVVDVEAYEAARRT